MRANGGEDWTYRVTVVNTGAGAAGAFEVALVFGRRRRVHPARSRRSPPAPARRVEIKAPRCESGDSVTFTADYSGLVAESREDNNVLARRCAVR